MSEVDRLIHLYNACDSSDWLHLSHISGDHLSPSFENLFNNNSFGYTINTFLDTFLDETTITKKILPNQYSDDMSKLPSYEDDLDNNRCLDEAYVLENDEKNVFDNLNIIKIDGINDYSLKNKTLQKSKVAFKINKRPEIEGGSYDDESGLH